MKRHPERGSFLKKMSIVELSIFLMVVITLILALIYFVFFREMDRELRIIETRQTGIPAK